MRHGVLALVAACTIYSCAKTNASEQNHREEETESQQTLIGGTPADPKDFPASVYASMGGSRCTATVVGPQVLIIASHCVAHGGTASFTVGPNQYTSQCARAPLYRKGVDHDLALCKVSRPVTGVPYESVNTDAGAVRVGTELLLTGYGCVRAGGGGGNDGVYRIGPAVIKQLPGSNSYDFVASGKSALCFGDSGGPAFLYTDEAKTKRVLVSVNSKGDIRTTSYLTSTSTEASKSFISEWSQANDVKICGVHEVEGCREGGSNPPPPPPPPPGKLTCREAYDKLGSCLKDEKPTVFDL